MKDLTESLLTNQRVIEFSPRRGFFEGSSALGESYLSVVRSGEPRADRAVRPAGTGFPTAIWKNSADTIIMNCGRWSELRPLQHTAEARYLFERVTIANSLFLAYFLFKGVLTRRQKYHGLFVLRQGRNRACYLGIERTKRPEKTARHYVSPGMPMDQLFEELKARNVRYCVLRWFEELPRLDAGEDLDLLVEDEDIAEVCSIMDQRPGLVPFDVYSKSGLAGSNMDDLPYLFFPLAEKALKESVLYKGLYRVPTWENYFYLLAYHAVFHKGHDSGLVSRRYELPAGKKPDHDYRAHLTAILSRTDLAVEDLSLEGLHGFLEGQGYAPPLDTQYKLSLHNEYLKARLKNIQNESEPIRKFRGLVCFVARERILEKGLLEAMTGAIQKEGFSLIRTVRLEGDFREAFAKQGRGGNWNQGPWPAHGGPPAVLLVAVDLCPLEPRPGDFHQHPGLTNRRILRKIHIRDSLNLRLSGPDQWFNGIHSSDNEIQALEYLSLAGADAEEIFERMAEFRAAFRTDLPLVRNLSEYSRRAKVELVLHQGREAVKKTFKPGFEWCLANEVEAHRTFEGKIGMPQLLEAGPNYLVTSYIRAGRHFGRRVSVRTLRKCLDILREIHAAGYSVLDFHPRNFLVDRAGNVSVIDFEFLHRYARRPGFLDSYDLRGIPEDFDPWRMPDNEIPRGTAQFDALWTEITGVRYEDLPRIEEASLVWESGVRYWRLVAANAVAALKSRVRDTLKWISKRMP